MPREAASGEQGPVLGTLLIAVAVALLAGIVASEVPPGIPAKGLRSIAVGALNQYVGILFLLSYYLRHKTFVFRAMMWVCEHFSRRGHRYWAFAYSAALFGLGTYLVLRGLGLVAM